MKILHPENATLMPCPEGFPNCAPLPVIMQDGEFTSFWQPEPAELDALNAGGSLKLSFPGYQPVLRVEVTAYPAISSSWPEDEQLKVAAEDYNRRENWDGENYTEIHTRSFTAGAQWQKGRFFTDAEIEAGVFAIVKDAMSKRGVQLTTHGFERYKQDHAEAYGALRETMLVALDGIVQERLK